eukprot:CAMPEP_0198654950 /NCGR_PEP_ID=MMETSP1467-20131203/8049_1 /TAXON_ID=1462469 /ORGANISM="unid. sp., Strain CCMP2135" /LENGTH=61 /DNA_ID=CAMNT_0044390949 /DNA_START=56 /DNA_END=236 /DNA_ORIENTATION=+
MTSWRRSQTAKSAAAAAASGCAFLSFAPVSPAVVADGLREEPVHRPCGGGRGDLVELHVAA